MYGYIFIAINVVAYFAISYFFGKEAYAQVGLGINNYKDLYPFFSSAFFHGGLIHLGMNMFFVYQVSKPVENLYYPKEQLFLYLGSVIPVSILSFVYMYVANIPQYMIGYSGVCFALMGALWFALEKGTKRSLFLQIVGFHVVIELLGLNIAWYAHLSGFIVGYCFSVILNKTEQLREAQQMQEQYEEEQRAIENARRAELINQERRMNEEPQVIHVDFEQNNENQNRD